MIDAVAESGRSSFLDEELVFTRLYGFGADPAPKVDLYPPFILFAFPTISQCTTRRDQEIDFIIGKKFIITAHYDRDRLHEFAKVLRYPILDKSNIDTMPGSSFLYFATTKCLMASLDHINHDFNEIQSKFLPQERDMVNSISHINRDLLNFKQILRPHKEVLESFEVAGTKFFGEEFSYYLRTIVGEFYKLSSILDGHRETILDLRDTNDSLLTTKTNDIMKTLTVTAFIILPLTFIGQIFGMSIPNIPLMDNPNAFWIIVGTMGVVGACLFSYFKFFKKWM